MSDILVKKSNKDILKELKSIDFDLSYINHAVKKYSGNACKIFNLKPYEGNILKQTCLSLGFDCALSRNAVTCRCDKTDALIFATELQYQKLIQKLKEQPFRLKEISQKLDLALNGSLLPLKIRNRVLDWQKPYVMGILNVTPDSFSDGGKYNDADRAFSHCVKMIEEGADIIDIGGESTRPNALSVPIDEEIKRVIPVIEKIRNNNIDIPISVDTRNFKTAKLAISSGADIINDVTGLDYDKNLFEYVVSNNIPSVIMHSNAVPAISCDYTTSDMVEDIYKTLNNKISLLVNSGMERKNIIADVGIGFGKSKETNFELLRRINEFTSLKVPMLIGISRKSFMKDTFITDDLDFPTAFYSALLKEVNIHRVHNTGLVKQFLNYSEQFIT